MNKIKIILSLLFTCFQIPLSGKAASLWHFIDKVAVPPPAERAIIPSTYTIVSLNQSALYTFLEALPEEPAQALLVELPTPAKGMQLFKIWQTPVMEAGLQQRFPDIRTFTGVAIGHPAVTVKIDYTEHGFHAMVYNGMATYFIDPYYTIADGTYIVYYKKDYARAEGQQMFCGAVTGTYSGQAKEPGSVIPMALKHGELRKTYLMALSCTGEYAKAVGGSTPTTSNVLGAMVTTLNRVNGIYERELAVSFRLTENNDQLVYLDPQTDPFTANNSGNLLMFQNKTNTNSVIGDSNYDIGHIFSTGGGGFAQLGCVCREDKAMGVTGSVNPAGDPFDVDYVSHEIGHQFSANHSFNRCTGEEETTAYEPGGGSTIMGYAGICGVTNNLQPNSDAYFHAISLQEMSDYITNIAVCGTGAPGVTLPAFPANGKAYTIPYLTNFELQAPQVSAAANAAVLYSWEQWNLGDFRSNEDGGAYFTRGPSFRSFFYDTSRWRIFPRTDSMVLGKYSMKGERMPALTRDLFFKATVRIVADGYGAFRLQPDSLVIHVVNNGKLFRVLAPNRTDDVLIAGKPYRVQWNNANTDVTPFNTSDVDIYLSEDGGYTFPHVLAARVPNNGSATVQIPFILTQKARIKIKGRGNIFFDISDADLTIADSNEVSVNHILPEESTLSIFPNPASDIIRIQTGSGTRSQAVLFNAQGTRLWQKQMAGAVQIQIPVASYPRGVYYISVTEESTGAVAARKKIFRCYQLI